MERCIKVFMTHMHKKYDIMKCICQNYEEQKELLSLKNIDTEKMDALINEMDSLSEQLDDLETEFQKIYPEVASYISNNGVSAIAEMVELREKNKEIEGMIELSSKLEIENHQKLVQYFQSQKKGIKQGRTGSRVAFGYYQNMSGAGVTETSTWESRQ